VTSSPYDEAIRAVRDVLTPHHIADRGVILGAAVWITTSRRAAKL
jgi:hypothetical protein